MKTFKVTFARDLTETQTVFVKAKNSAEAFASTEPKHADWVFQEEVGDVYIPEIIECNLDEPDPEVYKFLVKRVFDAKAVYITEVGATSEDEALEIALKEDGWDFSHQEVLQNCDYLVEKIL